MTGTRGSENPRGGPDSACGGAVDEGEATFSDDPWGVNGSPGRGEGGGGRGRGQEVRKRGCGQAQPGQRSEGERGSAPLGDRVLERTTPWRRAPNAIVQGHWADHTRNPSRAAWLTAAVPVSRL